MPEFLHDKNPEIENCESDGSERGGNAFEDWQQSISFHLNLYERTEQKTFWQPFFFFRFAHARLKNSLWTIKYYIR